MGKIKEYIKVIVDNGTKEDMEELSDMLDEVICEFKENNYKLYEHYKNKLYCIAYGPVISDDMRKSIVDRIGEHWSLEETEQVRKEYNWSNIKPNEFNVVMNMAYSDYKDVFDDNLDLYAKFSKSFINDNDAIDGKVYYYFDKISKRD